LIFQNLFNMEANATTGFDGMVLEIRINSGAFADITVAGGSFITGGYTHPISAAFGSTIAGRMAWSGLSAGTTDAPAYITTAVTLPAAANGQNIQLKWRAATDIHGVAPGASGVRIDDIIIDPASCVVPIPTPSPTATATATGTPTATPTGTPPGNTTGVALVEVYDLNQAVDSKLANLSTRAFVSTGDNIVIAGFILGGNPGDDNTILRGIGPSLTALGVANALANPTLELRDRNGALIRANDNWQDDPAQAAIISAAGLAPTNSLESGIAETLPPDRYTVLLAGLNNSTWGWPGGSLRSRVRDWRTSVASGQSLHSDASGDGRWSWHRRLHHYWKHAEAGAPSSHWTFIGTIRDPQCAGRPGVGNARTGWLCDDHQQQLERHPRGRNHSYWHPAG